MNPQEIFCSNLDRPVRGQLGAGNINIHNRQERRYGYEVYGKGIAEACIGQTSAMFD